MKESIFGCERKLDNYGEIALARANAIKQRLVDGGLDPSKIKTGLGSPEIPQSSTYKVTLTNSE